MSAACSVSLKMFREMLGFLDYNWVKSELLPLIDRAFGRIDGHDGYQLHDWDKLIREAVNRGHAFPIHEDFPSTVERLRLLLTNPRVLTKAEHDDFGWMSQKPALCIGIFVRHQISHGPYKLYSLGADPSPSHPRNDLLDAARDRRTFIYGGKFKFDQRTVKLNPSHWNAKQKRKALNNDPITPQDPIRIQIQVASKQSELHTPKYESAELEFKELPKDYWRPAHLNSTTERSPDDNVDRSQHSSSIENLSRRANSVHMSSQPIELQSMRPGLSHSDSGGRPGQLRGCALAFTPGVRFHQ